MPTISATVNTPDGACPVTLHTPNGTGPWAGVIMYPDAGGVRDTFQDMAARLAGFGYAVLLPDVYYRHGDWAPFEMATAFSDPEARKRLMSMIGSVTPDMIASDAGAFFDFLAQRPEVKGSAFGVCGYCMGGRTSVIVAGRQPDRVAAAGSIHGGGLVTDDPTSPHLLADRMKATVYVAGAENDGSFTADHAETLEKALTAANVNHKIEIYPAGHGFAVPDNPPYDAEAAERHWIALQDLFGSALAR
ncbi:MAG: dienelactone hydrolase family protein [Mycobacterium sp.]